MARKPYLRRVPRRRMRCTKCALHSRPLGFLFMTRQASIKGAERTAHSVRPFFLWARQGLPVASACLLAACGGGDSVDPAPPPVADGFTLGGTASGLGSGKRVVLQNNGADDLSVTANGAFTFAGRVQADKAYAVTVKTQPEGQSCAVAQGSGVATANVGSVAVACANLPAARYSVGGTVSGLAAGGVLVLQNNGGDDLGLSANGGFTFASPLAGSAAYAVTVKTQPAGQSCTLRNSSGTMASANVSSVEVTCSTNVASLPVGDWLQESCVAIGANSWARGLWRVTRESNTRVNLGQGLMQYGNAQCTGTGTLLTSPTGLGYVVFDRTDANATLSAFWGAWTQPSGLASRTVWARKGVYLCPLGDVTPSILPTLDRVEAAANLSITGKSCYTKL